MGPHLVFKPRVNRHASGAPQDGPEVFQLTMFGFRARDASNTPGCIIAPASNSLLIMRAADVSALPGCVNITRNGLGRAWKPVLAAHHLSFRSYSWAWLDASTRTYGPVPTGDPEARSKLANVAGSWP